MSLLFGYSFLCICRLLIDQGWMHSASSLFFQLIYLEPLLSHQPAGMDEKQGWLLFQFASCEFLLSLIPVRQGRW